MLKNTFSESEPNVKPDPRSLELCLCVLQTRKYPKRGTNEPCSRFHSNWQRRIGKREVDKEIKVKVTKNMRIALDTAMTLLIIAAMFVQLTGIIVHEIIGFTFFALIAAHLVFSASWIKKTAFALGHSSTSRRRLMLSIVGILLAIVGGALAVSSIAISNILSSAGFVWPFGSYGTWVEIHSISAYVLCAVVVVHLATHWTFIASALKVVYAPSNRRRISAGVYASAILGVGALGVGALTDISPMDSTQAIVTADQGIFDSTSQQETTLPQQEQTEQTYSK